MKTLILAAAAVMVLLAACGTDAGDRSTITEPGSMQPSTRLSGGWELIAGTLDDEAVPIVGDYRITITFDGATFGGTAACNSYGGSFDASEGTLTLSDVAVTEMACEPAVMASEAVYLQSLGRIDEYGLGDGSLELRGDGVTLQFAALQAVPTAALVDTIWTLDTLIDGDTSRTLPGASRGHRGRVPICSRGDRHQPGVISAVGDRHCRLVVRGLDRRKPADPAA